MKPAMVVFIILLSAVGMTGIAINSTCFFPTVLFPIHIGWEMVNAMVAIITLLSVAMMEVIVMSSTRSIRIAL